MRDFIERLRAHPVHIRQRIAIGTAVGVTAFVAIVWIAGLATSGVLALDLNSPTSIGASGETGNEAAVNGAAQSQTPKSNFSQLLGAIGALTANRKPALNTVGAEYNSSATATQTTATDDANQNATTQTTLEF